MTKYLEEDSIVSEVIVYTISTDPEVAKAFKQQMENRVAKLGKEIGQKDPNHYFLITIFIIVVFQLHIFFSRALS